MRKIFVYTCVLGLGFISCNLSDQGSHRASMGILGDATDVETPTQGGVLLVGGGGPAPGAYEWMIARSGGGDVVVITASGNTSYGEEIWSVGGMNSVETLNITSRELADNDTVAAIIRSAECLFIAGGDQSNYMRYWRGTQTQQAINYLLNEKKAVVGGTSAGCAILSGIYYSGENGSAVSDSSLINPYHPNITLYNNDLLQTPYLQHVITDQHYVQRQREGRHVAFLARAQKDWTIAAQGIAPNEQTAVCIDDQGMATIFGNSEAYFLKTSADRAPERCERGQTLQWNQNGQAIKVYEIKGSSKGNGQFSVRDFSDEKASGGKWMHWYVQEGKLLKTDLK
jgi:cyanophycinase